MHKKWVQTWRTLKYADLLIMIIASHSRVSEETPNSNLDDRAQAKHIPHLQNKLHIELPVPFSLK